MSKERSILTQDELLRQIALKDAIKQRQAIEDRIAIHKQEHDRIVALEGYKSGDFKRKIIEQLRKQL